MQEETLQQLRVRLPLASETLQQLLLLHRALAEAATDKGGRMQLQVLQQLMRHQLLPLYLLQPQGVTTMPHPLLCALTVHDSPSLHGLIASACLHMITTAWCV